MTRTQLGLALIGAIAATPALANEKLMLARVIGHHGFTLPVGPVTTNGTQYGRVQSFMPAPSIDLNLALDFPLSERWVLGAQTTAFFWESNVEYAIGYAPHATFDAGLQPRLRHWYRSRHRTHELFVSAPVGLSFDYLSAGQRYPSVASASEGSPGFHAGLGIGALPHSPIRGGFSFEAGVVYHRLTRRFAYRFDDGRTSGDTVVYEPWVLFFRAGFVLPIGSYTRPETPTSSP